MYYHGRPLLTPPTSPAQSSPLDGDTVEVLHNTHAERIRLSGIAFGTINLESYNHDLLQPLFRPNL